MTELEYALRTVMVASGRSIQIAHAVAPGTLMTLCGTMAVPEPGSRWDDTDPAGRCDQCVRGADGWAPVAAVPTPEPGPVLPEAVPRETVVPEVLVPEPVAAEPALHEPAAVAAPPTPSVLTRIGGWWGGFGLRARVAIVFAVVLAAVGLPLLLILGGGFHPDPNSAPYRNGFAYGHDLMNASNDVPSSCTQATTDDPQSADGKNFIAGCEAGYAARTP